MGSGDEHYPGYRAIAINKLGHGCGVDTFETDPVCGGDAYLVGIVAGIKETVDQLYHPVEII